MRRWSDCPPKPALYDASREFLAIGAANLVAGAGSSFAVSGGMSQSLVNESAGARTPLSGLIAPLFTLFVMRFGSGLLRNLPQPVLAAIVLAAVLDRVRHPENDRTPGVLVVRCESALLYFNVDHVRDRVVQLVGADRGVHS